MTPSEGLAFLHSAMIEFEEDFKDFFKLNFGSSKFG
jgi:hypothetical protein